MSETQKLQKTIETAIYQYRTRYPNSIKEVEQVIAQHLAGKAMAAIESDIDRSYQENYIESLNKIYNV